MGEILKETIKHGVPTSGVGGEIESSPHPCISVPGLSFHGMHRAGFVLFCRLTSFHYSSNKNRGSDYELWFINLGM